MIAQVDSRIFSVNQSFHLVTKAARFLLLPFAILHPINDEEGTELEAEEPV